MSILSRGGAIGQIPEDRIFSDRPPNVLPKNISELLEKVLKYQNAASSNVQLMGSLQYSFQPYPSDIDTINHVNFLASYANVISEARTGLQDIIRRVVRSKGIIFTDFKGGTYPNGESVHWTAAELLRGARYPDHPDIKGQTGEMAIDNIFQDQNTVLKLDIVTTIGESYTEVSMIYVLSNSGHIFSYHPPGGHGLVLAIAKDAGDQYEQGKYFKTVKRIFTNARIQNDTQIGSLLQPLLTSNVSALAMFSSQLDTVALLVSENLEISTATVQKELGRMLFKMSSMLDIEELSTNAMASMADQIKKAISNYSKEFKKGDSKSKMEGSKSAALNILSHATARLRAITNAETVKYLRDHGIYSFRYFGPNYFISNTSGDF